MITWMLFTLAVGCLINLINPTDDFQSVITRNQAVDDEQNNKLAGLMRQGESK